MGEGRVYGRNPVLALLRSGGRRTDEIAVLAGGRGPLGEVVALARRAGVKVSFRTRDQLTAMAGSPEHQGDRKSTRLNSSHVEISYAVFCLKKKKKKKKEDTIKKIDTKRSSRIQEKS